MLLKGLQGLGQAVVPVVISQDVMFGKGHHTDMFPEGSVVVEIDHHLSSLEEQTLVILVVTNTTTTTTSIPSVILTASLEHGLRRVPIHVLAALAIFSKDSFPCRIWCFQYLVQTGSRWCWGR